jgi:hypothetical protein
MGRVRPLAPEPLMNINYTDPNQIVRGAHQIGRAGHIFRTKDGKIVVDGDGDPVVDVDKVYYDVRAKKLDVSHNGRELISTVGRIRNSVLNTPKSEGAA